MNTNYVSNWNKRRGESAPSDSATSSMYSFADVFHPIDDEKPQELTFREYVRAGGYFVSPNRLSYQEYRARKVATKRTMAMQLLSFIVVLAIVVVLGFLALHFVFPLI